VVFLAFFPFLSWVLGIHCGMWYDVSVRHGQISLALREGITTRAQPKCFAWDIETTKRPLKFPDERVDQVFMISYMVDGEGYLIINREIVGADIENFEYTPRAEFTGPFTSFNEPNEVFFFSPFFIPILTHVTCRKHCFCASLSIFKKLNPIFMSLITVMALIGNLLKLGLTFMVFQCTTKLVSGKEGSTFSFYLTINLQ